MIPEFDRWQGDQAAQARAIRLAAVFLAVAAAVWELLTARDVGVRLDALLMARSVQAGAAIIVGFLSHQRQPLGVLRILALALVADVILINSAITFIAPALAWETTLAMVVTVIGAAAIAPWGWRLQSALAAATLAIALPLLWTTASPGAPAWVIPRISLMLVAGSAFSILAAWILQRERFRLRASEVRYRGLFNTAGDAIAILRHDGTILGGNERFGTLVSRPVGELVGAPIGTILSERNSEGIESAWTPVRGLRPVETEQPEVASAILRRADGTETEIELTMSLNVTPDGTFIQAILRDVADRRAAERHSERTRRLESLGQLSARLAHQFNNLLTGVLSNASLLRAQTAEGEAARQLDEIAGAVREARRLTKSMLAFTAHDTLSLKPVPVRPLVDVAVRESRDFLPPGAVIEAHAPADLPPVTADAEHLGSALTELIRNGCYSLEGVASAKVTVSAEAYRQDAASPDLEPGQYVRFSVVDNGRGMDRRTLERVHEPFFSTRPLHEARGLGLARVYWVARVHHGAVRIESEPNQGTSVHLFIPAAAPLAPPLDAGRGATPAPSAISVLVVDDEEIIRRTLRRALTRLGYAYVTEAADGPSAIEALKASNPEVDLAILDIVLPGGGVGLLKQMLELKPALRVLVSSGFGPEGEASRMLAAGARGYLQKPYEIADLAAALRGVMVDRTS